MRKIFALSILGALALGSCALSFGGDVEETWEITGDDKESCTKIYEDFWAKTIAQTNYTVEMKSGDKLMLTEKMDGDKSYVLQENGTENWLYKEGEKYYYLVKSGQANVKREITKDDYDTYRPYYYNEIMSLDGAPSTGVTWSAKVEGKGTNIGTGKEKSSAKLTFSVTMNGVTASMEVGATDGLARKFLYTSLGETVTGDLTFGGVTITLPDTSNW